MKRQHLFSSAVLLLTSAVCAFAQTAGSGAITGTITDPAGAVVPGATVVVHNAGTNADRSLESNGAGVYSAEFLQPGSYEITVSKAGFSKIERKGIVVEVGRSLTVDFPLTVQAGAATVTITDVSPVVDTEKTEFSQQMTQDLVQNLPLVGRRWDNFVLGTAAVTSDGGLVSYRGVSGLYNENLVDGANNNQAFFSEARGRSTAPYTYSLDSIQEFHVSTSNYSAELGQAAGGIINATTKSGTNTVHGDVFYYLRYPALNALDPIAKASGNYTQAIHQQQQFGASVGGPAIKNKLFYFFTYDGSRKVFPITFTSTAFPSLSSGNITCPTALSPAQCSAANAFLRGNLSTFARTGVNDIGFGKLDYQLNSSNHFSAALDIQDYHSPNSYNPSTTVNNGSVSQNGTAVTHTRAFVGSWDATLSNTMINNFRFSWGQDLEIAVNNAPGPSVGVTNLTGYGMPNALPRPAFPNEHRLQFTDTLSWVKGRHTIKAGYDFNIIHEVLVNLFSGGGVYNYSSINGWLEDVFGVDAHDGQTGRHYSQFVQVNDPITHTGKDDFYNNDYAGFVEDSWKFRPNVTFNLGLRYESQVIPQPPQPNNATPITAATTTKINTDTNNLAPRIGIAYEPFKDTVIRAGYGGFYGKTSNSTWYAQRVENGIYQQTFTCNPTTVAIACPSLTFPNVIFAPPGGTPIAPFAGALTPQVTPFTPPSATQLVHGITKDYVNPFVQEGELAIEQSLPGNFSLSVSYLFSRGERLPVFLDGNIAPATTTHTYDVLNSSGRVLLQDTEPWYTTRLNPQTGIILLGESVVNSWYNAGVISLRKPMSHGVEFLMNYTYSHSLDDGAVGGANGTFFGTDPPVDPYNLRREYSSSDLDQRHRFSGSVVYQPHYFAKLSNKVEKYILDGWSLSSAMTVASAQPLFVTINGFPANGVDSGLTGGTITNTGTTTGGRPTWLGRNVFRGHPLYDVDFRIARDFPIYERLHFQIIGEAFNLFNHTNISSVNTTGFSFVKPGSNGTFGTTSVPCPSGIDGCLLPSATFQSPTSATSSNALYGARQLQVSAKIFF